jgi:hypothetical protein
MLASKIAHGQRNSGYPTVRRNQIVSGTLHHTRRRSTVISRIASFKRIIIAEFRSEPFNLGREDAERCAGLFLKRSG